MPKLPTRDKTPDTLRPYIFHGVDLSWRDNDDEATADCPFCDREGKFSVNIKTSKYRCLVCGEGNKKGGGNPQLFLEKLWSYSDTSLRDYKRLARDRKLMHAETLISWEVVYSSLTDNWLVTGYTLEGKLGQLYRYTTTAKGMRLLPTPTMGHKIHGLNLYDKDKSVVYLCEGPWDAMALWEILGETKETEEGLVRTASVEMSLLADANVLAVPGCNTFFESWSKWFSGKDVFLCFDNDHERKNPKNNRMIPSAGLRGMERVTNILSSFSSPPNSISYLCWGENGIDLELPHGTDVRDVLTKTRKGE